MHSSESSYAISGAFAIMAADQRRESRQLARLGDGNASRKAAGRSRYLARVSKSAESKARRERKQELRNWV